MKEKIYTGSSKTLYQADEDYALIMSFNDTLKLQDKSSIVISGKGAINNSISAFLMQKLELMILRLGLEKVINPAKFIVEII